MTSTGITKLSESLTGRFEVNYFPHWTYRECQKCFKATPKDYAIVGGYPKSYDLIEDQDWLDLVQEDVHDVLKGTVLESAPIVRVSAKNGAAIYQKGMDS